MEQKDKAHLLILFFQVIAFVVALSAGVCVIILRHIQPGYSLLYFALISVITLYSIIRNVIKYKNGKTNRKN